MDALSFQKSEPGKPLSELTLAVLLATFFLLPASARTLPASARTQLTEPEVAAQIQRLKDKDPLVRRAAAGALGSALRNVNAAVALGRIGPGTKQAVPALIAALKDPDAEVRRLAVVALGGIGPGPREVVPALIAALKDDNTFVRWSAAYALGMIGPGANEAVAALIALLRIPMHRFAALLPTLLE
jgi:HEAT repeat protein